MEPMSVWSLCRDIYARHGHSLKVPKSTDLRNTYQWRYATILAGKFDEWRFGEEQARQFIESSLLYAKSRKLLHKGLAIFCQANMLKVCYDRSRAAQEISERELDCLRKSLNWTRSKLRPDQTLTRLVLSKPDPRGYPNLVLWHRSNKLTDLCLALSRDLGRALRQLDPEDREVLPSDAQLYFLRNKFLSNPANLTEARKLLQGDLRDVHQPAKCQHYQSC